MSERIPPSSSSHKEGSSIKPIFQVTREESKNKTDSTFEPPRTDFEGDLEMSF
jgi:hypothetical protein